MAGDGQCVPSSCSPREPTRSTRWSGSTPVPTYVTKPFRLAELLARVRACSGAAAGDPTGRRRYGSTSRAAGPSGRQGAAAHAKEFDVLRVLVREAGRVVPREQLLREVWAQRWLGSTKTLDMHISWLRRKLRRRRRQPALHQDGARVGFRSSAATEARYSVRRRLGPSTLTAVLLAVCLLGIPLAIAGDSCCRPEPARRRKRARTLALSVDTGSPSTSRSTRLSSRGPSAGRCAVTCSVPRCIPAGDWRVGTIRPDRRYVGSRRPRRASIVRVSVARTTCGWTCCAPVAWSSGNSIIAVGAAVALGLVQAPAAVPADGAAGPATPSGSVAGVAAGPDQQRGRRGRPGRGGARAQRPPDGRDPAAERDFTSDASHQLRTR